MEEIAKNKQLHGNIDVTTEEFDELAEVRNQVAENKKRGLPYDFNISRTQMESIGKFITPFEKVPEMFISVQRGRGNSESTIKHSEILTNLTFSYL